MADFDVRRRELLAGLAGALVTGCAGQTISGTAGPPIPAPQVRIGDRWVYHFVDGFRMPVVWDETHQVVAVGADGIRVRVIGKGPTTEFERFEQWSAPGIVTSGPVMDRETRPFDPPMERYRYPLTSGERWDQMFAIVPPKQAVNGRLSRWVRVGGFESVTVPAGTFNAIGMRIFMTVDDEEFWRTPDQCNYLVWYAPEVGAMIREEKEAQYREKGGMDSTAAIRSQHTIIELTSFSRGAG